MYRHCGSHEGPKVGPSLSDGCQDVLASIVLEADKGQEQKPKTAGSTNQSRYRKEDPEFVSVLFSLGGVGVLVALLGWALNLNNPL